MTALLIILALVGITASYLGIRASIRSDKAAKELAAELARWKLKAKQDAQTISDLRKVSEKVVFLDHVENTIAGTMENTSYWRVFVRPSAKSYSKLSLLARQNKVKHDGDIGIFALLTDSAIVTGMKRAEKHPEDLKNF